MFGLSDLLSGRQTAGMRSTSASRLSSTVPPVGLGIRALGDGGVA